MSAISQRPHMTLQILGGLEARESADRLDRVSAKSDHLINRFFTPPAETFTTALGRKPWRIAKADWRSGQAMEWERRKPSRTIRGRTVRNLLIEVVK